MRVLLTIFATFVFAATSAHAANHQQLQAIDPLSMDENFDWSTLQNPVRIPGPGGKPPAAGNQSFVQSKGNYTCTGTTNAANFSCITSLTSATTAGNLVVAVALLYPSGISTGAPAITGDTFTNLTLSNQGFYYTYPSYVLSAAGGTSSFTATFTTNGNSGTAWYIDFELMEYHRVSGSWALDTQWQNAQASCSTCAAPALTLSGSDDTIVIYGGVSNTVTNPGGVWTNPNDVDNSQMYGTFIGALDQATYTAPNISQSPAGNIALAAAAFK